MNKLEMQHYIPRCKAKKTRVVAKLTTTYGQVYFGVNVESACHSLSICAERASIINTIIHLGPRMRIKRIEVYAEKEGIEIPILPCGACRQLVSEYSIDETELCGENIKYWMPNPYL